MDFETISQSTTDKSKVESPTLLVFRALKVGDMLCAIPALRALRTWQPSARIVLVGLPWCVQLLPRFADLIDQIEIFPGHPGLPEQAADLDVFDRFLKRIQGMQADLALQMHGSGEVSNGIVEQFGACRTVGFARTSAMNSASANWVEWPEQGHEIRRCLALVRALGARVNDESLYFPVLAEDIDELAHTGLTAALDGHDYVCIHAGARSADRRWPTACFAQVGDALATAGFRVVLTGSGTEWSLAEQVRQQMHHPAINAALPCSLGALAALLRDARLLVCNDTGVSHLVAALGLSSVVVFTGSDPERWAPLDRSLHPAIVDREGGRVTEVINACQQLLR